MENIGTYILDAVLAALLGVILRYGVPYIKALITAKNFAFVSGWVDKAVAAAEQTIQGSGLGEKKKAFVIGLLSELNIVVDNTVDAMIEAAVKVLNDTIDRAAAKAEEKAAGGNVL